MCVLIVIPVHMSLNVGVYPPYIKIQTNTETTLETNTN